MTLHADLPRVLTPEQFRGYETAKRNMITGGYSRCKSGTREDLGIFVRSKWEANIARYLNWLVSIKAVKSWSYETKTFEFHKIRRGSRFYTPDFEIWFTRDDFPTYWEVKGWMDPKSKTKLKRMAHYYPEVKLIVIDERAYRALRKECANAIPNWE